MVRREGEKGNVKVGVGNLGSFYKRFELFKLNRWVEKSTRTRRRHTGTPMSGRCQGSPLREGAQVSGIIINVDTKIGGERSNRSGRRLGVSYLPPCTGWWGTIGLAKDVASLLSKKGISDLGDAD